MLSVISICCLFVILYLKYNFFISFFQADTYNLDFLLKNFFDQCHVWYQMTSLVDQNGFLQMFGRKILCLFNPLNKLINCRWKIQIQHASFLGPLNYFNYKSILNLNELDRNRMGDSEVCLYILKNTQNIYFILGTSACTMCSRLFQKQEFPIAQVHLYEFMI